MGIWGSCFFKLWCTKLPPESVVCLSKGPPSQAVTAQCRNLRSIMSDMCQITGCICIIETQTYWGNFSGRSVDNPPEFGAGLMTSEPAGTGVPPCSPLPVSCSRGANEEKETWIKYEGDFGSVWFQCLIFKCIHSASSALSLCLRVFLALGVAPPGNLSFLFPSPSITLFTGVRGRLCRVETKWSSADPIMATSVARLTNYDVRPRVRTASRISFTAAPSTWPVFQLGPA